MDYRRALIPAARLRPGAVAIISTTSGGNFDIGRGAERRRPLYAFVIDGVGKMPRRQIKMLMSKHRIVTHKADACFILREDFSSARYLLIIDSRQNTVNGDTSTQAINVYRFRRHQRNSPNTEIRGGTAALYSCFTIGHPGVLTDGMLHGDKHLLLTREMLAGGCQPGARRPGDDALLAGETGRQMQRLLEHVDDCASREQS